MQNATACWLIYQRLGGVYPRCVLASSARRAGKPVNHRHVHSCMVETGYDMRPAPHAHEGATSWFSVLRVASFTRGRCTYSIPSLIPTACSCSVRDSPQFSQVEQGAALKRLHPRDIRFPTWFIASGFSKTLRAHGQSRIRMVSPPLSL